MREFGFELALCAHLEATQEAIVARQLSGAIRGSHERILDIVVLEPGPTFDHRAAMTDDRIPLGLIESTIGPGRFRDWRRVLGGGEHVRRMIDRAVANGVLEITHRGGRELVRLVDRYPEQWVDRIIGFENKPDLSQPGDLYEQVRFDVSLGLLDAIIVATESHVTRAHRHRLPDEVGIWRFEPTTGEKTVIQEPTPLAPQRAGIEINERTPGRVDIEIVPAMQKHRTRLRLAENAYAKGWRTYRFPPCQHIDPEGGPASGLPWCEFYERIVDPARICDASCPGFRRSSPPAVDLTEKRDRNSPWRQNPPDRRRRQSLLDQFTTEE